MTDPTYPLFPTCAFLGFALALIPLPWHLHSWNSGTCFYMIWAAIACLNQFVNSVVWAGNALNPAPVWCDISIRITLGASVGIPAASLCINRRLYKLARLHAVAVTHAEKRRAILVDSVICVLFPLVFIAIQYVPMGHRFDIFEDIGCYPALYNSIPSYLLSSMWPIVIGLCSAVYCVLSLRAFMQRRASFSEFLSSNHSMSIGRYFRLMALATTDLMMTIPLAIFVITLNATVEPVQPWVSWDWVHFHFAQVNQHPAVIWRMNHPLVVAMELSRWVVPLCAFVFFAFFGFAEEARRHYRLAFWAAVGPLGFTPSVKGKSSGAGSLPFVRAPKPPQTSSEGSLPPYEPPKSSRSFTESVFASLAPSPEKGSGTLTDEQVSEWFPSNPPTPTTLCYASPTLCHDTDSVSHKEKDDCSDTAIAV